MPFHGTYDPKKVLGTFGPVLLGGYADGVFITAARNNQSVNLAVGSAGDAARAMSNDKSGIITVTLMATSTVNALLSAIAKADELSGDGVNPFILKDLSGADLTKAAKAWIQKPADGNYGREVGDGNREWIFETDNLDIFHAGIP